MKQRNDFAMMNRIIYWRGLIFMDMENIKALNASNKDLFYDYLRLESVAAQNRAIPETVKYLKYLIERIGGEVEVLDDLGGNPLVYAYFEGEGDKTLLYYNHYDVQPEDPVNEWNSAPFEPREADGKLFARGVADNKANLMTRLNAIEIIQANGKLPLNVKFIIEGEEEIGSPNINKYLKKYADKFAADACVWEFGGLNEDGQYEIDAGIKGLAYFELEVSTADTDIHSAQAAVIDNAAWRLVQALATMKNQDNEITIDNFYEPMTEPTAAENKAVQALPFYGDAIQEAYGLSRPFITESLKISPQEALVLYPTLTINGVLSGYIEDGAKTVLPRRAMAKIESRLVPGYTPEIVNDLIRSHLDRHGFEDVKIHQVAGAKPYRSDMTHPFIAVAKEAAEEVHGKENVVLRPNNAGTGPMWGFGEYLNVPIVSAGAGYAGARAHAPNENIRLEDFDKEVWHQVILINKFSEV